MHGINQNETIFNAAFANGDFHFRGYVDKSAPGGDVEPEFFAIGFHAVTCTSIELGKHPADFFHIIPVLFTEGIDHQFLFSTYA